MTQSNWFQPRMLAAPCTWWQTGTRVLTAWIFLFLGPLTLAQGRHEFVIRTGDPLPGGPESLGQFQSLVMNSGNTSQFHSIFPSGGQGLFQTSPGSIAKIIRTGDAISGGGTFNALNSSAINSQAQASFVGFLAGTPGGSSDDTGIFRATSGSLTTIVREGQSVPGIGTFSSFSAGSRPSMNDLGNVFFRGTASGVTGMYRGSGAAITPIVRLGDSAVGNGSFSIFSLFSPNNLNQISFYSALAGASGGNEGIFRSDGSSLVQIARTGQSVGTFLISSIDQGSFINDAGEVAFMAHHGFDDAIMRGSGGALTKIAQVGEAVPEGNGTLDFFAFGSFSGMNQNGQVLYHGLLTGSALGVADDEGIYLANGTITRTMAREGQSTPSGNGVLSSLSSPVVNNRDVVLYSSGIASVPGGTPTHEGIFLSDGSQTVEVTRAPVGSTSIGHAQLLNQHGQFTYTAFDTATSVQEIRLFTPDMHWRAAGSGIWDTNSNWTLGIEPAEAHDVVIDSAVDLTVVGPSSDTIVRSIQIGGATGENILQLDTVVVLSATHGIEIASHGKLQGPGIVEGIVDNNPGGHIIVPAERQLTVRGDLHQNGNLEIENNGNPGVLNVTGSFSGNGGFDGGGNLVLLGELRPGNSIGVLAGDGNLFLRSNSMTVIELAGTRDDEFD
ncbi:MAG TPA: choice-of-anchor tandem repeat NxxGxxAF-containing protein, partial [Pirellulaceae bacterium]